MSALIMKILFPPIELNRQGWLSVGDGHEMYFEESGNPEGKPCVFVHGGPGGGSSPAARRFFDPKHYRIVLFDQRGCGKSTPHASLEANTTWHLIADMEQLREHLGIDRWLVFGGSWGSTLSIAYAQKHPDRVTELVLRGIFLLRPQEIRWFYQEGASAMYPDAWQNYLAPIPDEERSDLVSAFHKRLTSADEAVRLAAARAWSVWEASTSFLHQNKDFMEKLEEPEAALAMARIECHYFVNGGFSRHRINYSTISMLSVISRPKSFRGVTTLSAHQRPLGSYIRLGLRRRSAWCKMRDTRRLIPRTPVRSWRLQIDSRPASTGV
jgi:proline iminopeptidase